MKKDGLEMAYVDGAEEIGPRARARVGDLPGLLTKFRPHRGSLSDSMLLVVEVATRQELLEHIRKTNLGDVVDISIEPYSMLPDGPPVFDDRIGWHTYIVTAPEGGVLGFTNGPLA